MEVSQQVISDNFYYAHGSLFNKKDRGHHSKVGHIAGSLTAKGYRRLELMGRSYYAHRFIWILFNGSIKDCEFIDHINGNKSDNRIENLRKVDASGNNQNLRTAKSNNETGFLGVVLNKKTSRFEAQIRSHGLKKHIGTFDTAKAASEAYLLAKRQMHGTCSI